MMMEINVNDLPNFLAEQIVEVTFTKKDGSNRVMRCTLNKDIIPVNKLPTSSGSTRKTNPDVFSVFDTDIHDWRSFRKDSITQISFPKN